jgi:hypothetical protein
MAKTMPGKIYFHHEWNTQYRLREMLDNFTAEKGENATEVNIVLARDIIDGKTPGGKHFNLTNISNFKILGNTLRNNNYNMYETIPPDVPINFISILI